MKIDAKYIAELANLTLLPDEITEFEKQLNDIVNYVEKLKKVDTSNIEPTAAVNNLSNQTRNDKFSKDSLDVKDAISGGKEIHNDLFVVEKLVDTT